MNSGHWNSSNITLCDFVYQRHSVLPTASSNLFSKPWGTIPVCRQVKAAPLAVDWSCASCWSRAGDPGHLWASLVAFLAVRGD